MAPDQNTINAILPGLSSSAQKTRTSSLEDLTAFLDRSRNAIPLPDKQYQRIFDDLFKCLRSEKENNARRTGSASTTVISRISKYAKAVRLTYEHSSGVLKRKTLINFTHELLETLQDADGALVAIPSLVSELLRTFLGMISNPIKVDQLTRDTSECWLRCIDFCVDTITNGLGEVDAESMRSSGRASSVAPLSSAIPTGIMGNRIALRGTGLNANDFQQLLECMHRLVLPPTAPIKDVSARIIQTMCLVLKLRHLAFGRIPQDVFGVLGVVLYRIQAEDIKLASDATEDILPYIRYWWQPDRPEKEETVKSARDEILKTLFSMQLHLQNIALNGPRDEFRSEIEDLLNTMWTEYSRRDDKSRLQLGDISFHSGHVPDDHFQTPLFSFYYRGHGEDRNWAILQSLAFLEEVFQIFNKSFVSDDMDDDGHLNKRRRLLELHRVHQRLRTPESGIQVTALQLIPFISQSEVFSDEDIWGLLHEASKLVSHKSFTISSWAMIASASCALRHGCDDEALAGAWRNLWQSAVRTLTIPGACRASCVLLYMILQGNLVPYHKVSSEVSRIVTNPDFNGPVVLVDASLHLMLHLLHLRNVKAPNASQQTCSQVIRWTFMKWHPDDMNFASAHSAHASPHDICALLRACCGLRDLPLPTIRSPGGSLGQAWRDQVQLRHVTRYLALLEKPKPLKTRHQYIIAASQSASAQTSDPASSHAARSLILELFGPKVTDLQDMADLWGKRLADGGQLLHSEKVQSLFSTCTTLSLMLPALREVDLPTNDIQHDMVKLLDTAFKAVGEAMDSGPFFTVLIRTIQPYLPEISVDQLRNLCTKKHELLDIVERLNKALSKSNAARQSRKSQDEMDIDDDFGTQKSNDSTHSSDEIAAPRFASEVRIRMSSYLLDVEVRLVYIFQACEDIDDVGKLPPKFVDYIIAMPDCSILACRDVLIELLNSDVAFKGNEAVDIIEKVGSIMSEQEFESCEVALMTCIDAIYGLLPIIKTDKSDLSSMVGDMYYHIVKNGVKLNLLSSNAKISLAKLLLRLIEEIPDYTEKLNLPDCRLSLLKLEETGDMSVKFHIGQQIPKMFSFFVLKDHDRIFVDVLETLPTDGEHSEGIAYRLYVLSELACHWPTLLRRCIYHIFEVPGMVPSSASYAKRGLQGVADTLKLESPQELFRLFAPQILYTWVPDNSLDNIPYSIFGFASLYELLMAGREEASAILIMRGEQDMFEGLAQKLGMTPTELIQENFGKIIAYSVAHGIAKNKNRSGSASDSMASSGGQSSYPRGGQGLGEQYLHAVLGDKVFFECVCGGFADAVSVLMDIFDQEDHIESSFVKEMSYSAEIMAEIKRYSQSDVLLPPNQQPLFKGKHLVNQLIYLCGLMPQYDFFSMWTSPLVAYIYRKLINTVHPALGSFHACSVLRKLRVLVCLSGQGSTESYPLEMLLQSLRMFIVDPECANDALGLSRYLLSRGMPHLKTVPSFLAGYGLSTLASLRVFLESSQQSTTQESQFRETMNKAREFHAWLAEYLKKYLQVGNFSDPSQLEAFRSITGSVPHIKSSGNAERGTHESKLLLEIFRDEYRRDQLLSKPARDLALGLLCSDFKLPEFSANDIICRDSDAVNLSTVVWQTCSTKSLSKEYLTWAGRVVGRSFAATGNIPEKFLCESRLPEYAKVTPRFAGSEQGLLMLLRQLSGHEDSATAGLAEGAIRRIVSNAKATEDVELKKVCKEILTQALYMSSNWGTYYPPFTETPMIVPKMDHAVFNPEAIERADWVQRMALYLSLSAPGMVVVSAMAPVVKNVRGFAEQAFPFIVHLTLLSQFDKDQAIRKSMSAAIKTWFAEPVTAKTRDNIKLILNTILYLRTQQPPIGQSMVDRMKWLGIDPMKTAEVATQCGLHKSALMFIEGMVEESSPAPSRTSTSFIATRQVNPASQDLLLEIFENIDDPDAYYGISQAANLSSALARMEYEGDGGKSLAFRGAQYDSNLRRKNPAATNDGQALVSALGNLGLAGVASSMLQSQTGNADAALSLDSAFQTARKLEQWNLPVPSTCSSPEVTVYKAFQGIFQATDGETAKRSVRDGFADAMRMVMKPGNGAVALRGHLRSLAVLTELDDVVNMNTRDDAAELLERFGSREQWMQSGRYEDVSNILSCRATTCSLLSQLPVLRTMKQIPPADARLLEAKNLMAAAKVFRFHKAHQESLNLSTALAALNEPCNKLGLNIDVSVKIEVASSLWDHGEMLLSIGMLKTVASDTAALKSQSVAVSLADILSRLGHRVSVARLESPDDIQRNYLEPALAELQGRSQGEDAGKVFHQFAMFCDEQLQNPDMLEDLDRLKELEKGKAEEVEDLKKLVVTAKDSAHKKRYTTYLGRAERLHMLDKLELKRVEDTRTEFMRLSIENYLLSLAASDGHDNDALRFAALWLERADDEATNQAAAAHLDAVPTGKFAALMNQLSSRLQNDPSALFQQLLWRLVMRICIDHPYHGMYHIWSGTRAQVVNCRDAVAISRREATVHLGKNLESESRTAVIWQSIDRTSRAYEHLAADSTERYKTGQKIQLKHSQPSLKLMQVLNKYPIPPPTMHLAVRNDRDYRKTPKIAQLEPTMSIAGGNSAPKVITAVGTDGRRYKQLVKGGNDDLRQDAIMEQVFDSVSSLLRLHRATQRRKLSIRTYKVLPLTPTTGIIEFVANTIPLHDFLMPAHQRYYPKDWRGNQCRKEISQVEGKTTAERVAAFRKVMSRFRPVMRFFFMENFQDPDAWFQKRLAYTRTTAAISMVGHILGLGDRHGHNILMDTVTGEVVHIDLGVAFELGRVLPIPEVVPFRLTRDIIDGMGVTKTEGVFRRCCEHTLDALREETYSIMTILDVLRYDPLYSWSMSPVRVAKLQNAPREADEAVEAHGGDIAADGRKKREVEGEAHEAQRALAIVRKKLSKTLSVEATVNDLINQAADPRNLAVLFAGWGAYA